ncbi:hypothetical protein [Zavarzinella formosa]|uniref:hypothetical protein n=1 Tax=Zavarzinella formosa TaxID=360055 RepID=UPI000308EC50|nr:hypothetical protein [Zavarzinella formosa]
MPVPTRSSRVLLTALVTVPWLMVGVQWFLVLPRFARLFDQFGLRLSIPSNYIIAAVKWAGETFFLSGWVFLVCVMLSMFRVSRLMKQDLSPKTRNRHLLMVFAVPMTLFILSWVGIAEPYSKLMRGLGK